MEGDLFLKRYQSGKRDFPWADLQGANLSGAALTEVNLTRANLAGANLQGANLSGANLSKANLTGANLRSTNLGQANLRKANLTGATLEDTYLETANLTGATMPDGTCYGTPSQEVIHLESDGLVETVNAVSDNLRPAAAVQAADEPSPEPEPVSPSAQTLWWSLAAIAVGYGCYGLVLVQMQAPVWGLGLVWATIFMGNVQLKSVWVVPVFSAVAVIAVTGISLGSFIFTTLVSFFIFVGLCFFGSILGRPFSQTLRDSAWFSGLGFIAMSIAPWIADGSRAYSGGGIVLNLSTFHLGALLVGGMIFVGAGCLFLVGEESFYRGSERSQNRWRLLEFGSAAGLGLWVGRLLG